MNTSGDEPERIWICLPWPARELSPNASKRHWRSKQNAKLEAYRVAHQTARYVMRNCGPLRLGRIYARLTLNPPDKRRRDLDNVLAALKPSLDGICAALGIDDSRIVRLTLEWGLPVNEGEVMVELSACSERGRE